VGESYYELLGVTPDASEEEIEQAYREKLKETHPDVSDDEDASERTRCLIEAKKTLTNENERERYDRVGHEAFIEGGSGTGGGNGATARPSEGGKSPSESGRRSGTTTASGSSSSAGASTSRTRTGTTTGGGGASAAASGATSRQRQRGGRGHHVRDNSWYDSNPGDSNRTDTDDWQVWDTQGTFAVNREGDSYQHGRMFSDQRALVLLGATFLVYPVLLFGALLPQFPIAVNLTVAMCVILVIAFLQSVPEVGIAVFGIWTVLLPLTLFWAGVDLVSPRAFLAIVAVVFPLGLSVLTRVAIRPVSAT